MPKATPRCKKPRIATFRVHIAGSGLDKKALPLHASVASMIRDSIGDGWSMLVSTGMDGRRSRAVNIPTMAMHGNAAVIPP